MAVMATIGTILATMAISQVILDSPIGRAKTNLFNQAWSNKPLPEQSAILLRLWDVVS
ncbi:unnamed protein product, partial [marine sediment metagenome]